MLDNKDLSRCFWEWSNSSGPQSVHKYTNFFTSTGSLSLVVAGLLGVLMLRGVFVELGVFGLNKKNQVILRTNNNINRQKLFCTYTGFMIDQNRCSPPQKIVKYFWRTTLKSICRVKDSWIKPPWRSWFEPANHRKAWLSMMSYLSYRSCSKGRPLSL